MWFVWVFGNVFTLSHWVQPKINILYPDANLTSIKSSAVPAAKHRIRTASASGSNPTRVKMPLIFFTGLGESTEYTVLHTSVYMGTTKN